VDWQKQTRVVLALVAAGFFAVTAPIAASAQTATEVQEDIEEAVDDGGMDLGGIGLLGLLGLLGLRGRTRDRTVVETRPRP
jgi:hypothetical protein